MVSYKFAFLLELSALAAAFPHMGIQDVKASSGQMPKRKIAARTNGTLVPKHFTWEAPGEDDSRAPCPMLNSLANHGFLPHDGRNITHEIFTSALSDGLNFAQGTIDAIFNAGTAHSPEFNASSFDLGFLHAHGLIEHDGSLSMKDSFIDPTNAYDEDTFNNFLSYFGDATEMTVAATANARGRHAYDMSKENPRFTILPGQQFAISAENVAMLAVWGHPERPVAKRDFYEYFFRNNRLPVELGWTPSDVEIGFEENIGVVIQELIDAHPADIPYFFNPGAYKN